MNNLLFNRYQITRGLGQGGFGKTFLAIDTGIPSKRFVVIKKLIPVHKEQKYNECIEEIFNKEASFLEELGKITHTYLNSMVILRITATFF